MNHSSVVFPPSFCPINGYETLKSSLSKYITTCLAFTISFFLVFIDRSFLQFIIFTYCFTTSFIAIFFLGFILFFSKFLTSGRVRGLFLRRYWQTMMFKLPSSSLMFPSIDEATYSKISLSKSILSSRSLTFKIAIRDSYSGGDMSTIIPAAKRDFRRSANSGMY